LTARINAPFFQARDEHGGVKGIALQFSLCSHFLLLVASESAAIQIVPGYRTKNEPAGIETAGNPQGTPTPRTR